jgi:hypothetical protein
LSFILIIYILYICACKGEFMKKIQRDLLG